MAGGYVDDPLGSPVSNDGRGLKHCPAGQWPTPAEARPLAMTGVD